MAGRVRILTAAEAGRYLDALQRKSAEPIERALALEMKLGRREIEPKPSKTADALIAAVRSERDGPVKETKAQAIAAERAVERFVSELVAAGRSLPVGPEQTVPKDLIAQWETDLNAPRQQDLFGDQATAERQRLRQQIEDATAYNTLMNRYHDALLQYAEAKAQADSTIKDRQAMLDDLRRLLIDMTNRLGSFIPDDVAAYFAGLRYEPHEARRAAAAAIRYWHSEGLIKIPRNYDIETFARAVEDGYACDTNLQHATNGLRGKIVPVQHGATAAHAAQRRRRATDAPEGGKAAGRPAQRS